MLAMYSIPFLLLIISHSQIGVWCWVMPYPDYSGSGYDYGSGYGSGEFGKYEMIIPSRFQQSYPLHGLVCFPDGLRLPCECDNPECPCCRDWLTGDCYRPTFYRWSEWLPCLDCNDLCDETQECRIKYDEVGPPPYPMYSDRKKRGLPGGMSDMDMHPFMEWMKGPGKHRCQVQRMECRERLFGMWSDWTVSPCSEECGKGFKMATRMCLDEDGNEMDPDNCIGGADEAMETRECNEELCVSIEEWMFEGGCWVYDGDCVRNLTRECLDGPALTLECSMDKQNCSDEDCSFGVWGEWEATSSCSETCGPGMQNVHRYCTDGAGNVLAYSECDGGTAASSMMDVCNEDLCAEYSAYSDAGVCDVDCGGGTVAQERECDTPGTNVSWVPPSECTDRNASCNTQPCVELTEWTEYSPCSHTCTPGTQTKTRQCVLEGTNTPASGCHPESVLEMNMNCNQGLCSQYTDYIADGVCEGTLDSCQNPQANSSRTCNGTGVAPPACLSGMGPCDPGPEEIKDILIIVNVGKDIDRNVCGGSNPSAYHYPDPALDNPALFPNFINLQNFLEEFICKFNNISDTGTRIAISKSQEDTTLCPEVVKHFNDTDQFTAIEELGVLCEELKIPNTLRCSQTIFDREEGVRASAADIILYILPKINSGITSEISTVMTYRSYVTALITGKVFAVMSADTALSSEHESSAKSLACLNDGISGLCPHFVGTTYDDVGTIITKLLALSPLF